MSSADQQSEPGHRGADTPGHRPQHPGTESEAGAQTAAQVTAALVLRIGNRLRELEQHVAVAESLTGGELAALMTNPTGSSEWFVGGVVSYATSLKTGLLGVPEEVVDRDGVISAACAEAMAQGARRATAADWAVATTGVAGPSLQEGHPAGTAFVGLAGPDGSAHHLELHLAGDRAQVRAGVCRQALHALAEALDVPGHGG